MPVPPVTTDAVTAAITDFINNSESTMNKALSSSVGRAILELRRIYRDGKNTEGDNAPDFDKRYQPFATTLARKLITSISQFGIAADNIKSVTKYIQTQAMQPNNHLDNVTLYITNDDDTDEADKHYFEASFTLPLKEVLWLVWQATQDHERFTQNYTGTPAAQLAQAKVDYPKRLLTLYQCLERIKKGICHHGVRNELVMTLNHIFGIGKKTNNTYQTLYLIEEPTIEAHQFIKEKLNEKFWQRFQQSTANQQALATALFEWLSKQNPRSMLTQLDPEDTLRAELYAHFKKHGNNPLTTVCGRDLMLPSVVDSAYNCMTFASDMARYPLLAKLSAILPAVDLPDQLQRNRAVSKIQRWIKTQFHFGDAADEIHVNQFYAHSDVYSEFRQHQQTLALTGTLDAAAVQHWATYFDNYFRDYAENNSFSPVTAEDLQALHSLHTQIETAKNNGLVSPIEQFFVNWRSTYQRDDIDAQKKLYAMVLHKQDKIRLSDAALQALPEATSPYLINRVLLHSITTNPSSWTPLFAKQYRETLDFVEEVITDPSPEFKAGTYTNFIAQFRYLWAMHLHLTDPDRHKETPTRPTSLLLLPSQVKNADEWLTVSTRLSATDLETTFLPLSALINKLLITHFSKEAFDAADDDNKDYLLVLRGLPEKRREAFIKSHWDLIQPWIISGEDVISLLAVLPPAQRKTYLRRYEKAFLAKVENGIQWAGLLILLPEVGRSAFFNKHLAAMLPRIKGGSELAECLNALPYDDRETIFETHKTAFFNLIKTGDELAECLDVIPHRDTFFLTNETELMPKIQNGYHLAAVLNALPQINKITFFTDRQAILLNRFKDGRDLSAFLAILPTQDALALFHQHHAHWFSILKNGWDMYHLMKLFTATEQDELLITYHATWLSKTTKIADLTLFLRVFSQERRQAYIAVNQATIFANIANGADVTAFLGNLPIAAREACFNENKATFLAKFTNGIEISRLLDVLPEACRLSFLQTQETTFLPLLTTSVEVASVLEALASPDHRDYFKKHEALFIPLIKTALDLKAILEAWRSSHIEIFFKSHENHFLPLIKNSDDLVTLLSDLSGDNKLRLFFYNMAVFTPLIENGKDLARLLRIVPTTQRNRFFNFYANHFLSAIQNGEELAEILALFDRRERDRLFAQHESALIPKIKSIDGMITVFEQLPPLTCFSVLNRDEQALLPSIETAKQLGRLLKTLPGAERWDYFQKHKALFWRCMHTGFDLADICFALRAEDTSDFINSQIDNCLSKLDTAEDVIGFFTGIFTQDIEELLRLHEEQLLSLFKTGHQVISLLELFPAEDRVAFYTNHATILRNRVHSVEDITTLISLLPYDEQDAFFTHHEETLLSRISGAEDVIQVLKTLPQARVSAFFNQYRVTFKPLLLTISDWIRVLNQVPYEDRAGFITQHEASFLPKMKDGNDVVALFEELPREERYDYLCKHERLLMHRIQNGKQLAELLALLPEDEQSTFFLSHQSLCLAKMKNGDDVAKLANLLPRAERLTQFNANKNVLLRKFKNGSEFAKFIGELPLSDRRLFFSENKARILKSIRDGRDFGACLNALPPAERESFLMAHPELLNLPFVGGKETADAYNTLKGCDRLGKEDQFNDYEVTLLNNIRNGKELIKFLSALYTQLDIKTCLAKHADLLLPNIDSLETLFALAELQDDLSLIPVYFSKMPFSFAKNIDFDRYLSDSQCAFNHEILSALKQIKQFMFEPAQRFAATPIEFLNWIMHTINPPLQMVMGHAGWLKLLEAVASAAFLQNDIDAKDIFHAMQVLVRQAYETSGKCRSLPENRAGMLVATLAITHIDDLPARYHEPLAAVLWEQPSPSLKQQAQAHLLNAVQKGYRHLEPLMIERQIALDALSAAALVSEERDSKRHRVTTAQFGLFTRNQPERRLAAPTDSEAAPKRVRQSP